MTTKDEQALTRLISLLHQGAAFYRQAERQAGDSGLAQRLKHLVKAQEFSLNELQPYLAALHPGHGAETGLPGDDEEFVVHASSVRSGAGTESCGSGTSIEDLENVENAILAALDQASRIPASQSLRSLLSDIRDRTHARQHGVRQLRQTRPASMRV